MGEMPYHPTHYFARSQTKCARCGCERSNDDLAQAVCVATAKGQENPCIFCEIVAGRAPAKVVGRWAEAIVIVPLNPVTEGHLLVIPTQHVMDARIEPITTGMVMARAASLAPHPCNLITSVGAEATQTVFHLHVHIVPRREGDGLPLPWTPQQTEARYAGGIG